ncbi:lymphocyte cytosolic protein 2 isoform X2 [Clinocottus analis]|uniref:lymphocyte cytosolic protein 2 isoform X2 n=1 Tax=Clinocottus analis TaxID=304258 RepID=UPI0035C14984
MSLNNIPSKVEVLGWSPQSLADYMRRQKLSGCDKLVIKGNISGAKFMEMTMVELQVFPCLYVPLVTKIQSEINKENQKKGSGQKSKPQKYPKPVLVQEEKYWESDEFDSESGNDCEGREEDGYICTLVEPQTAEQEDSDEIYEISTKSPSPAEIMKPPRPPRVGQLQDGHCRAGQPNLHINRSRKPRPSDPSQTDLVKSMGDAVKAPGSSPSIDPKLRVPKPKNVPVRASKLNPVPPVPTKSAKVNNSMPGQSEGLDPSWYGGKVTRRQAEVALREVNKDGAFVVRDSSKGSTEHPYTLMLLKQAKVYNIMIRNQGSSYSLGSSLKTTQSFPGVKEMITHHTNNPLQLIDATDQSAEAQNQCCLLHPAGL